MDIPGKYRLSDQPVPVSLEPKVGQKFRRTGDSLASQRGMPVIKGAQRGLVPVLALLVYLLAPAEALCGQALQGAFGQVLGQRFDTAASSNMGMSPNEMWFEFKPNAALPVLSRFRVLVTPLGYRIHGILAEDTLADIKTCLEWAESLFATVAQKYKGDEHATKLTRSADRSAFRIDQQKLRRRVTIVCDETGKLSVLYEDQRLREQAAAEHKEWNQLSDDFQARRYASAVPRLRKLADRNHVQAQFLVGYAFRRGHGLPQDDAMAEAFYLKAARAGMLEAQFNLGTFYFLNNQFDRAQPWLLRAAERGNVAAQNNLAQLHLKKGALYNEAEAFRWFLRAAAAGHVEAQYNTCHMYSAGDGVARNEVEAYKWCDIAAASGHEKARDNRDFIAKRMTAQQIERAGMLSQQWIAVKRGK